MHFYLKSKFVVATARPQGGHGVQNFSERQILNPTVLLLFPCQIYTGWNPSSTFQIHFSSLSLLSQCRRLIARGAGEARRRGRATAARAPAAGVAVAGLERTGAAGSRRRACAPGAASSRRFAPATVPRETLAASSSLRPVLYWAQRPFQRQALPQPRRYLDLL